MTIRAEERFAAPAATFEPVHPLGRLLNHPGIDVEVRPYYFDAEIFDAYERQSGITDWDFPGLQACVRDGDRVLDVGCGPGRATLDIARNTTAREIVGVDTSMRALAKFRDELQHAPELADRMSVIHGDIFDLDLPLGAGYNCILLADCTVNFVAEPHDLVRLLRRLAALLSSGGRIALAVFDDGVTDQLAAVINGVTTTPFTDEQGDTHVLWWAMSLDTERELLHRSVFVQLPSDGPKVKGLMSDMYDKLWTPSAIKPLLDEAGLTISNRHQAAVENGAASGITTTVLEIERAT